MVRKLIEGFLKRKGAGAEKKEQEPEDNIPDELPPLGEETAVTATAASQTAEEPPEELPGLDVDKEEEKEPEVVGFRTASAIRPSPQTKGESDEPEAEEPKEIDGFFAGISKLLKEGKPVDSLISHDLLANMKESWGIRKESAKTGLSGAEEKRVTTAISETLAQLRLMESKWRAHKLVLDEYEKLAKEQEDKMKEKEKELKALLKKYKIYRRASEDKVVMLKDSIPISRVSDLVNALRTMDVPTFNTYVNRRRNDFSRLASDIDKKLGDDLKEAGTKQAMLRILEAFVKRLSE